MPTAGFNESDTRAKLIDPALHAASWIEHLGEAERDSHGEIHREQSAVRIDILDGKPLKRGVGGCGPRLAGQFTNERVHRALQATLVFYPVKLRRLSSAHCASWSDCHDHPSSTSPDVIP